MGNQSAGADNPRRLDVAEFSWSIDNFTLQDGVLLTFGWVLHESVPIVSAELVLTNRNSDRCQIGLTYGAERKDVEAAFPERQEARSTGFHFLGRASFSDVQAVEISVTLDDGSTAVLPTNIASQPESNSGTTVGKKSRLSIYTHLIRRTIHYIARGEFANLKYLVSRYLAGVTRQVDRPVEYLSQKISTINQPTFLVIDHSLGGGANQFRNRLVNQLLADGSQVVILSFQVQALGYFVEYKIGKTTARLEMPLEEFLARLSSFNFSRIYFNSVVSFTKQLLLVQTLTSLRLDKNVPITFYLHDYHSICPSHFLINPSGTYCGLPESGTCRGCLPNVRDGLATLFVEKDIDLWRKHWLNLLAASDEIICFSESSRSLLLRAHPGLPAHQAVVRPHDIEDFPTRQVAFDSSAALHLGVVGHINAHKGAPIVQEVARLMDLRHAGERLTVFGALDGRQAAKCLTVTGRYDRNDLADLITQHGVNMLAFTSIWPETFSFVISELMSLGLPIICFDMGAPAERVSAYALGRVVPICDAAEFYQKIVEFHDELRRASAGARIDIAPMEN